MRLNYQHLKPLLRGQLRTCRHRAVRVKVELILLAAQLDNIALACSRRGFSRKFFYKWYRRLRAARFQIWALEEKSRRPKRSPKRIAHRYEQRIKALHRKSYGALMIQAFLMREEGVRVSTSTICHVLNRRKKLKKKRRDKLKAHRRRYELHIPGQRVQMDVKYVPEFVNGKRIYNFVAVDECTRWRFARGYEHLHGASTVDFLERLKQACPFSIACIQTDNGFEFTYRLIPWAENKSSMPEHPMADWCKRNRIRHRCIPPGEKELNGKVERSHRIDEQYFYWKAPTNTLERFNRALERWIDFFNNERPHGGLAFLTPMEKLKERTEALRDKGSVEELLEPLRLKFQQTMTKSNMSKEDREIHDLLEEAKKYAA